MGDSPEISGKGENYTMTEIINNSLEAQNDLLNKIRMYGDNSINDMMDIIPEKTITEEMNTLIKKIGSRK